MAAYKTLRDCLNDLEAHGHLLRIKEEVDPLLEMAAIHRKVFNAGGPAVFYEKVKGSPFPAVSNLFGTKERTEFIFRRTLPDVRRLLQLKAHPEQAVRHPLNAFSAGMTALRALPKKTRAFPFKETSVHRLPQIQAWPDDGGPFVTLPQVFTQMPGSSGILQSNLGMYRIQLAGNQYAPDKQIGLHYQIHRGIAAHHAAAIQRGEKLKVSIFIGGPPAHTFAAVMPLPEGISELLFAGALGGRRFRYIEHEGFILSADADFVITGYLEDHLLPEGPFGDHLGYYSLKHDFPVVRVHKVFYRPGAVWPFTVVGRPPQEDTVFGQLIHEITGPLIPKEIPGLRQVHAVDEAGVHPLLLAVGSERYVPYQKRRPMELLTIAHAILGFGQLSLAKYLFIAAGEDNPSLDANDVAAFFIHFLERVDWRKDIHFLTRTTMDTLDYSGKALNEGSKAIFAAAGKPIRRLTEKIPPDLHLPESFSEPEIVLPGILAVQGNLYQNETNAAAEIAALKTTLSGQIKKLSEIAMIVVVDDSAFTAQTLANFLWVTFTRSDPAPDVDGVDTFVENKHWGCNGPLIIDARIKPHHAPELEEDAQTRANVDRLLEKYGF